MEASAYIDELKDLRNSKVREAGKKQKESSGNGIVLLVTIILTVAVVAYFVG